MSKLSSAFTNWLDGGRKSQDSATSDVHIKPLRLMILSWQVDVHGQSLIATDAELRDLWLMLNAVYGRPYKPGD